jgi:hypothetical protein
MAYSEYYKRILHRLGYYNYQNGLIYRHLNQGNGWNDHLGSCRKFILRSVEIIRPERVTVLGSGWLLDLPLDEMLELTKSVTLIDIVHPPEAVRQVSALGNVELIEADVTGGLIEEVWNKAGKLPFYRKLKTLDGIVIPDFHFPTDPGLVVSLNILSQLETLPLKLLRSKSSVNEEEFSRFRMEIQKRHIALLSEYNSVLITDHSEVFIDRKGNSTEVPTVITELPEGKCSERWTWDFDLKGSDYYEKKSVMNVIAIMLQNIPARGPF